MTGTVLTLGATGGDRLLFDLVVILATAAVVSLVFSRLRLAAIPAYLVAGAIIGPGVLGVITNDEEIEGISHLAIVLLMFGIGLHMETSEVRGELAPIIGIGSLACAVVTLWVTPLVMLLGEPLPAALLVGAAVSMSSTAAVMRLLQQRREVRQLHGRVAFGSLIVQDLYAVGVLACIPLLVAWQGVGGGEMGGGADAGEALARRALLGVGGLLAIVVFGKLLLPRLLYLAGKDGGTELVLIVGAGAALGSAAATGVLGFSPELGAFLAGFLLASTPARHQLLGQLAPVRDLFLPIFFVAVGLGLDLGVAVDRWWLVLLAVPMVLVIKVLVMSGASWVFGISGPVSVMSGTVLAQTGEFTLVVVAAGAGRGLVSEPTEAVVGVVVGVTLMVTPTLFQIAPGVGGVFVRVPTAPWRNKGARRDDAPAHGHDDRARAVVVGFGPVGREATNRLERAGFGVTVIELNPETIRQQRRLGRRMVYGDAANAEVLHEAGVEHADAVLLTMPDHATVLRACRLVRGMSPDCFLAVRSAFLSRGMQALGVGADQITIDEIATAAQMAEEVCAKLSDRLADRLSGQPAPGKISPTQEGAGGGDAPA